MEKIIIQNELNKLTTNSLGRGFAPLSKYPITSIAKTRLTLHNYDTNTYFIESRTPQDQRMFHHGNGQFSYASAHYATTLVTGSTQGTNQMFAVPFQVNQTTGAITVGSGVAIHNGNPLSGSYGASTGAWSQSGEYVFSFSDHVGTGTTYYSGVAGAYTCNSNNTITGAQYINYGTGAVPIKSYDNYMIGSTRAAGSNTAYFVTNAYVDSPTQSSVDLVCSYNGSTLSTVRNAVITSAAGGPAAVGEGRTNYSVSAVSQYAADGSKPLLSSQLGTIRVRLDSNGSTKFDIINNVGVVASTTDTSVANSVWDRPFRAVSFDLSTGNQLVYLEDGTVLLRSGNTLTNVSATADWYPGIRNDFQTNVTPVGPDTWVAFSSAGNNHFIKFSINPTTYKITVIGSYSIAAVFGGGLATGDGAWWHGAYVTGTNNQFLVTVQSFDRQITPVVCVFQNPLTGKG